MTTLRSKLNPKTIKSISQELNNAAEKQVYFITYRYNHHSLHSGYDRLTHYFGTVINPGSVTDSELPKKILSQTENPEAPTKEVRTEWNTMINARGCIYHILYPEKEYPYLDLVNKLRQNQFVATIHGPPSHLHEIDEKIHRFSALICLGTSQYEYLVKFLGLKRVFLVPHGIDTEYFSPPASFDARTPNICLFVGFTLRDFITLRKVVELISFKRPEVKFVFVISPSNIVFKLVSLHPNIEYRANISESELLELYRSASMMVMPLLDSTANNAILEAISCGLPVVTTDVGSVRDYLNPECAVIVPPRDPVSMAEEVLKLLDDRPRLQSLSENARQRALKFSWPEIVKQLQAVYQAII